MLSRDLLSRGLTRFENSYMEISVRTSLPDQHFIILTVILMLVPELSYFSTMFLFPLLLYKRTIKRGETVNMTELHKCTRHTHFFPCINLWCLN